MGKEELRKEAKQEEEWGRKHENREYFVFAKTSYENAKQLREQVGDQERVESLQRSIERVKESRKWQKELEKVS